MTNIWENLAHERVTGRVEEATGKKLTNLLVERNSYINRVYELEEKDSKQRLIVKFYRPGRWTKDMIQEEIDLVSGLKKLELPVIPPLDAGGKTLFECEGIYFAVYPKMGGRALDEFDDKRWTEIGRIIGRLHLASEKHISSHRIIWKPGVATAHHLTTILESKILPKDFEKSLTDAVESFIGSEESRFERDNMFLIHGDIHRGNFIHRPGEGIYLVDFDDMCVGPAVQDMWMLLPDSIENSQNEINNFLKGYGSFRAFDRGELGLIPALRAMRMIHFAAWCAIQKGEPRFEKHFPEWGTAKYWNQLIRDITELTGS